MKNIPTRVKRWLASEDGSEFVLIRRATLATLTRLYDYLARWLPAPVSEPTGAERVDVRASLDHLQLEIDALNKMLGVIDSAEGEK